MKPYYEEAGVSIYCGDCVQVLGELLPDSFDACICDPPYGLSFMGKAWDHGVPDMRVWAEVLRVLKPGAFLLAFGGTRTYHRLTCAIEDAGFEIRDCLMWLYGSGFPKSLDISKAIDKQAGTMPAVGAAKTWDGYGTALKPAWEPIIVAMKPCDGTFAENALKHGVAGLNIDAGRIGIAGGTADAGGTAGLSVHAYGDGLNNRRSIPVDGMGRWPANLILDEEAAAMFPDAPGQLADASTNTDQRKTQNAYGAMKRGSQEPSAERRYTENGSTNFAALPGARRLDGGSAARFFYTAKADSNERGTGNDHPTVKPLDLMRWLCKLVAPPEGGSLLDPFAGSGSTLVAGRRFFKHCTGIDIEERYCEIAAKRLSQGVLNFTDPPTLAEV